MSSWSGFMSGCRNMDPMVMINDFFTKGSLSL